MTEKTMQLFIAKALAMDRILALLGCMKAVYTVEKNMGEPKTRLHALYSF